MEILATKDLERRLNRLSISDRFRLLNWLAHRHPEIVKTGLASLGTREDAHILAWHINDPTETTEGSAGEPDPPAAMG
jgi:hypothetical protein